jgi:NADH-quinone oxidoreductase subunit B
MFNNYAIVQGVDQIVPVDVYAPGCPPGPETLIHAIITLHEKISSGEITRRREISGAGAGLTVDAPLPDRGSSEPTHVKVKVGNRP